MSAGLNIEEEIFDLTARRDINTAICNYMRGQDRLLPEVQRLAFHDDAHVDCGLFAGGPDEYVAFAQGFLAQCRSSQHVVGQTQIDIDGDTAQGEVYFIAYHRITEDGAEKDLIVAGRYIDQYERRHGAWKIAKRRELIDWARTDAPADDFLKQQTNLHLAARGSADFSVARN